MDVFVVVVAAAAVVVVTLLISRKYSCYHCCSFLIFICNCESHHCRVVFLIVSPFVTGCLVLISGKEGKFLQKVATPHHEETYYAPQVLIYLDGVSIVVFGTGGQGSPGGLYAVPLHQLVKGNMLEVRHVEN